MWFQVVVVFYEGEAIHFSNSVLSPEKKFDIIDTSNLADHVQLGLMNVLLNTMKRLKWYC